MSTESTTPSGSDDAVSVIAQRTGRPEYLARSIVSEIEKADDEIKAAFDAWVRNEYVPDVSAGDLSLSGLASEGRGIVPEALGLLARIRRDPHFASKLGRFDRIVG